MGNCSMRVVTSVRQRAAAAIDRTLGITPAAEPSDDRSAPSDHLDEVSVNYRGLFWALRKRVDRDDVFVDLRCGEGKAVFLTARLFRLREVIGVDCTPELAERAALTAERLGYRLRTPVRIERADAASWRIPDDVTIVYLHDLPVGEVFEQAMEAVVASVDRCPRRLTLIYGSPTHRDLLLANPRFRLRHSRVGRRVDADTPSVLTTEMYEVISPPAPALRAGAAERSPTGWRSAERGSIGADRHR